MKYTNLKDSPEYLDDLIKLIEKGFEYKSEYSYKEDFYLLMQESNWSNLHILVSNKSEIVSHVGVRQLVLSNGSPILLLGGIFVNPIYKGEGFFKELFSKVINLYKDSSALMVLWSDLDGLYKKFNFHEAGEVIQTGSLNASLEDLEAIGFKSSILSKFIGTKELQDCYSKPFGQELLTIKREQKDWEAILNISSAKFFTLSRANKLASYLFMDKGMDMPSIIHELGFSDSGIQEEVLTKLHSYKLWLPFIEEILPEEEDSSFYSGIFKISNLDLFKKLVSDATNKKLEILNVSDDEVKFIQDHAEFVLGHQDFLNLLLLPSEHLSPIPLWISGIESI